MNFTRTLEIIIDFLAVSVVLADIYGMATCRQGIQKLVGIRLCKKSNMCEKKNIYLYSHKIIKIGPKLGRNNDEKPYKNCLEICISWPVWLFLKAEISKSVIIRIHTYITRKIYNCNMQSMYYVCCCKQVSDITTTYFFGAVIFDTRVMSS